MRVEVGDRFYERKPTGDIVLFICTDVNNAKGYAVIRDMLGKREIKILNKLTKGDCAEPKSKKLLHLRIFKNRYYFI